jgi:dTDP-4-amino-4,6-dideoxygalactose transaminase
MTVAKLFESRRTSTSELEATLASLEEARTNFVQDYASQIHQLVARIEENEEQGEVTRRQADEIGGELQRIIRLMRKPGG